LLAAYTDYFQTWHVLVAGGLLLAWLWLGGYLLRRAVLPRVSRKQAAVGRCYGMAFLATSASTVGGAVMLVLAIIVLKMAVGEDPLVQWMAPMIAALAFVLLTYVVLYAAFELPAGAAMRVWARAFGPLVVLTVALGLPTAIYSYRHRHRALAQRHSLVQLRLIHGALARHYGTGPPPISLSQLVVDNVLRAADLQAWTDPPREVDFFYFPAPLLAPDQATERLLACDYAANHPAGGRGVLFTNGRTRWCTPEEFQPLLARKENEAFADALKKAEARPPAAR